MSDGFRSGWVFEINCMLKTEFGQEIGGRGCLQQTTHRYGMLWSARDIMLWSSRKPTPFKEVEIWDCTIPPEKHQICKSHLLPSMWIWIQFYQVPEQADALGPVVGEIQNLP